MLSYTLSSSTIIMMVSRGSTKSGESSSLTNATVIFLFPSSISSSNIEMGIHLVVLGGVPPANMISSGLIPLESAKSSPSGKTSELPLESAKSSRSTIKGIVLVDYSLL